MTVLLANAPRVLPFARRLHHPPRLRIPFRYLIPERSWQPNGHGYVETATAEDFLYLYAEYVAAARGCVSIAI